MNRNREPGRMDWALIIVLLLMTVAYMCVVVITADNSLEGELRAFDLGASDIIVKPFEPHVVKRRVHNIIELYLHKHNLEDMVEQQAQKLRV